MMKDAASRERKLPEEARSRPLPWRAGSVSSRLAGLRSRLAKNSRLAGQGEPVADGRVVVEEPGDQGVRVGVGLVDAGELDEGGAVGVGVAGAGQGVAVALRLEEAAQRVLQRAEGDAEGAQ